MKGEAERRKGLSSQINVLDFFLLSNCSAHDEMFVSKDEINLARTACLYDYLWRRHPDHFKKTASNLYLKGNNSLVIRRGGYGYKDYATSETGNGIDFLTMHLGYSFQEAVQALAGTQCTPRASSEASIHMPEELPSRTIHLPPAAAKPYSRLYAFLMKRGIPGSLITLLVEQGLLYQSKGTNNIVFTNPERDYYELRGTYTYAKKPFHGCGKTRPDRFWYLRGGTSCDTVYITEAAIDAISLFLLHRQQKVNTSKNVYASIGGVSNNATIDRIKRHKHAVLAVDNDEAGEKCRRRHSDLEYILPVHKDWNEDLTIGEEK